MAELLEGKKIAEKILERLKSDFARLPVKPLFADLVIGSDPVSMSFVKIKEKIAKSLGIDFEILQFADTATTELMTEAITELNSRPHLSGLIIQLPVPHNVNKEILVNRIDPAADIDCLGETNRKLFYGGQPRYVPPTAAAVMALVEALPDSLLKKNVLVVGQGELVGRPVSELLRRKKIAVSTADRSTGNLPELLKNADVVISGTGQPGLIKGEMLKKGCAVIDAGTAESSGAVVGDVDFQSAKDVAGYITPVPGGVGPLTVAMLYQNLYSASQKKFSIGD